MKTKRRRRWETQKRVDYVDVPIFCGLVVQKGFDPDHQGPPAPEWKGLGIDYDAYAFNADDLRWHRTKSMHEMHGDIPTGTWPIIGGTDATT